MFHLFVYMLLLASNNTCTYNVHTGDTLSAIATAHQTTWQSLASINPSIRNPNLIYPNENVTVCSNGVTYSLYVPVASHDVVNEYPWGWCTWAAMNMSHNNLNGLGDAYQWFDKAKARGMSVGYEARAGSTVVFAPGYHTKTWGTSSGHVAHVIAVSNGKMLIKEMNNSYYGGFGIWDTVWVDIVPGASFIY